MASAKKKPRRYKYGHIQISRELRDIIHGYIMSDGYMMKGGSLQVDQGRKQIKFVEWLYDKLAALRTDSPIQNVERLDSRTNTMTYSNRFYTRNLLKGFRHMWYRPVTNDLGETLTPKRLPKSIACFFSSTTISVWFAGDGGNRTDSGGAKFEVTAFTPEERLLLQKLFKDKFDLPVHITRAGVSKKGTTQWNLSIHAEDYPKFREIITQSSLIPTIFPNKLHKKP